MAVGIVLSWVLELFPSPNVRAAVGLLVLSLWCLHSYLRLHQVPGPFLATISNLPRVLWILSNRAHDLHIDLHKRYGKLVRFGPNMVSVGDPAEIPNLYGYTAKFAKVKNTPV